MKEDIHLCHRGTVHWRLWRREKIDVYDVEHVLSFFKFRIAAFHNALKIKINTNRTLGELHSELLGQFRESDLGCNTQYSMMT